MVYTTMSIAHDALMNEFNMTQKQLTAVRRKLEEAVETDKVYLTDVFGDPVQRVEYENFQKKVRNLRRIEMELSTKAERLADAIADFNEHNW